MPEVEGDWAMVSGGTVNRRGTVVVDVAGGGAASSADGGCQGVSGDAGAKLLVSLQAASSAHPARAMLRSLAEGMGCAPERRRDRRPRLRTDFVENSANVLVQDAIPGREGCEMVTGAGQGRWLRQAMSWVRSGEGAEEVTGSLPEPPVLSGPGDHLAALATWYGLLHRDIRGILDEVGPQPGPAVTPSLRGTIHAFG